MKKILAIGIAAMLTIGGQALAASNECGSTNGCLGKGNGPTSTITKSQASCKVWSYTTGSGNTMGVCVVSK